MRKVTFVFVLVALGLLADAAPAGTIPLKGSYGPSSRQRPHQG